MESKGYYGKVAPLDMDMEDQPHNKPPHPKPSSTAAILAVSAFLVALVIGISLAVVFGVSRHHPPAQPDSIRLVCNVTRYPDSCFATISSIDPSPSPSPDPELILHLSIRVCLKQAIASQTVSSSVSEECAELYEDARSRIADALEAMGGDGRVGLSEDRLNDVQTWLSAALTDQETCLDGLEEMNKSSSTKLEEFKVNAQKLKEYLSNSLAIAANIHPLLHRFGLHLH